MKSKKIIVLLLPLSIFLSNCEYDKVVEKEAPKSVSFKKDVMPLLNKECISCHGANQTPPDLSFVNAYTILTESYVTDTAILENNVLYKRMIDKSSPMPPAGVLPTEDLDIVRVWITTGALDN